MYLTMQDRYRQLWAYTRSAQGKRALLAQVCEYKGLPAGTTPIGPVNLLQEILTYEFPKEMAEVVSTIGFRAWASPLARPLFLAR